MPSEVLESFIRQYIACQETPEVQFAWQGGEPTLLGIDYFRSVVSLQEKHTVGKKVINTIQTNGTLLTDDWCRFFKKHGFLVGLSIDGPREIHDRYRIKANGAASSRRNENFTAAGYEQPPLDSRPKCSLPLRQWKKV